MTVAKDKVLCEIPYGGMLLINNMIPHRRLYFYVNHCFSFFFRNHALFGLTLVLVLKYTLGQITPMGFEISISVKNDIVVL